MSPGGEKARLAARVESQFASLVDLCRSLVRIDSTNPPGDTAAVVEAIEAALGATAGIEHRRVVGRAPVVNLVARVRGAGPGRRLVLNGHLDTFPIGEARWQHHPLGADLENGRIDGRGACDMKAGVAALVLAFVTLAEFRDAWGGELVLALVGDEETGGRWGTQYLLANVEEAVGDAMLNADTGSPRVVRVCEKDNVWVELEATGVANHAVHVHLGRNAVDALVDALGAVRALAALAPSLPAAVERTIAEAKAVSEAESGEGEAETLRRITVNIGRIEGGIGVNTIPDPRAAPLRLTSHVSRLAMLASLPIPNRIGSTAKCPRSDQQRPHQYSPNNENRQVVSPILFALDQAPGAPTHWPSMRNCLVFLLLFAIKVASRVLFRVRLEFVREVDDPWADLRVVALLNHTSLFEPLLAARAPNRLLWQIAAHGVVPVADKTAVRPIVGRLFRFMARHVVPVTRERDKTWAEVLERLRDERALIVILPEGRMKRRTGLDLDGNPMTIRGGIADILESVPDGRLFIGYSEGLHHIHAPGDRFPRLFRRVWLGAEVLDIPTYRRELRDRHGPDGFKAAVIQDLTERRDRYCQPARHRGGKGAGPGRSSQPGADQEEASRENSVEADALPVSASGEAPGPSSE